MPMKAKCPQCGRERWVTVESRRKPCGKCRWGHSGQAPTPGDDQQIVLQSAADRLALIPKRSWWAVNSRAEFDANFAEEAGRLRLIGANIPRSQQRNIEADF